MENSSDIFEGIIEGASATANDMANADPLIPLLGKVAINMGLYYKPVITIVGLLFNGLMIITLRTPERRELLIASYYIAVGIADMVYLAASFLIWLHNVKVYVLHIDGLCQLLMYMTYMSNFISTWLLLSPVIERVVILCNMKFEVKKPSVVIGFVTSLAVLFYTYTLWTFGVFKGPLGTVCAPREQYIDLTETLFKIDTIANSLIPVVITVLFVSILISAIFSSKYRYHMRRRDDNQKRRTTNAVSSFDTQSQNSHQTLKYILLVTTVSYVLTFPATLERLKFFFQGPAGRKLITIEDHWRNDIFICLHLTSLSTKLVVFMLFSELRSALCQNLRRVYKRDEDDFGPSTIEELAQITVQTPQGPA